MKFTKYTGCGNDFLVTNDLSIMNNTSLISNLCDRHFGFGADGLIVVKTNPFEMVLYNADGSRASMCGNGIRVCANFIVDNYQVEDEFIINTLDGDKLINIISRNPFSAKVKMGKPSFASASTGLKEDIIPYSKHEFVIDNDSIEAYPIHMGVPHLVVFSEIEDIETIKRIGPLLESHPSFLNHTNVDFVKVINKDLIQVITYERGCGLTLACGTGCCASVKVSYAKGLINKTVSVKTLGGMLKYEIINEDIYMEGPSKLIGYIETI